MKTLSVTVKFIIKTSLVLFFCCFFNSSYAQFDEGSSPQQLDHLKIKFFQNGVEVSCINPHLEIEIYVEDPHDELSEGDKIFVSLPSSISPNGSAASYTFVDANTPILIVDAYYFDHKNPNLNGGVTYFVSSFSSEGVMFHNEYIQQFIPFCIDQLKGETSAEIGLRGYSSENLTFIILNSLGQTVKIIPHSEKEYNIQNLGLPAGIYYMIHLEDKKVKKIKKFIQ